MTYEQALQMMRDGFQLTHECFTPEEFFEMINGRLVDEQGYSMASWYQGEEWQNTGWEVVGKRAIGSYKTL